jgi:hypothetical protein
LVGVAFVALGFAFLDGLADGLTGGLVVGGGSAGVGSVVGSSLACSAPAGAAATGSLCTTKPQPLVSASTKAAAAASRHDPAPISVPYPSTTSSPWQYRWRR